ncbi:MAG: tetratricopeptide repeat protein [Planctomycetota bacterium]|jgi:tetratricopeptide (TPR) repeat protein
MIEFAPDADGQLAQMREERAARGAPSLTEVDEWLIVGNRLLVAGFGEGAVDAFRRLIELDAGVPQAHFGLGHALLDAEDPDGALKAFRNALDADAVADESGHEALLDDPDEDPWYGIGLAEHVRGNFREALAAYGRCAERYPEFPEVRFEMVRCHLALGEPGEAGRVGRDALEVARHRPRFCEELKALLSDAGAVT